MPGTSPDVTTLSAIRAAVAQIVESDRLDDWIRDASDSVLIRLMAPLEMLSFQYYRDPPSDKHLVRAARVTCEAMAEAIGDCPPDLARALRQLSGVVGDLRW